MFFKPDHYLDILLTLYPSFLYPYFNIYTTTYGSSKIVRLIKKSGYCSNKYIDVKYLENHIEITTNCNNEEYVKEVTGTWYIPWNYISEVHNNYYDFVVNLINKYSGIRLSVSSIDKLQILISVFLSRNTSFHVNTVKWINKIISRCTTIFNCDYTRIGKSYHLRQLNEILNRYREIIDYIISFTPKDLQELYELRRKLLTIKYVGVKTADAYILYTTRYSFIAPIDRHYIAVLKKYFKLTDLVYPKKYLCEKYMCSECPLRNRCAFNITSSIFGRLNGWIQTLSYLHGNKIIDLL